MKFTTAFSTLLALLPAAYAATLSYDPVYDNGSNDLSIVACSDGENGLLTAGYTTFDSLPKFPYIGAASAVSEWNDVDCGTCWQLTYTNSKGVSKSINMLAIDATDTGFVTSKAAMNALTNNQATQLGRVTVTSKKISASSCGL